ncbi:PadR family transcriptional regulator [Thermofilum pendens]|uniref:Transcriptional regulator, PadR family n=1 Tax=Thermofilum pendens (strain DSM 2475 / Hrk 5) TaxID=368408 RepID=A1RWE5_THEPD|nr:PadR family transcriptional regulator [Thermofilum pendens]ABL77525.1 transcriptional regulator, PadR family [Thermofilum pendens Hrk 5]
MAQNSKEVRLKREKIRVNTVIKLYTLILLAEGEKHGYELMRTLEQMIEAPIGPSQIYPFLRNLENAGLVTSREAGSRDKKVYSLTPQGYEFLKEILEKSLNVIQTAIRVLGREKVCLP